LEIKIYAGTRKEWRNWLRKNKKEKRVFLIKYKKHTGKPSLNNREAMEEAICFGWIDTTIKRLDEERYQQCFVKRTKNSRWSNNTQRYAREMIAKRKMTKEGLYWYQEGLKKPTIDLDLPKNPETPQELLQELKKVKAVKNFEKFPPSSRRYYIHWILIAKRPETKEKRIKEVVKRTIENKKPNDT